MQKLKIGIAGGIGSGKSTIARIIETMGYPVYYSDSRAKMIMVKDILLVQQIKENFGEDIYSKKNELNREKLGAIVFKNPDKLTLLNSLVHPAVARDYNAWIDQHEVELLFKESAILFKSGIYKEMDYNILVTAPKNERIKRTMERDNISRGAVLVRMKNQWVDEQRIPLTDFIIDNSGKEMVIPQIISVLNQIKKVKPIQKG